MDINYNICIITQYNNDYSCDSRIQTVVKNFTFYVAIKQIPFNSFNIMNYVSEFIFIIYYLKYYQENYNHSSLITLNFNRII